jgi:hypothetical protein
MKFLTYTEKIHLTKVLKTENFLPYFQTVQTIQTSLFLPLKAIAQTEQHRQEKESLKISSEETKNSECWWKFSAGEANRTLLLSENPESEKQLW